MTYGSGVNTLQNTLNISRKQAKDMLAGYKGEEVFGKYSGGTASSYFNYAYNQVRTMSPLAVLGVRQPACINPKLTGSYQAPDSLNFQIQALCGIRGILSTTLLFAWDEMEKRGVNEHAMYCISIHD